MEKHLVDERKQTNTNHESNQSSNEDSTSKQPAPTENDSEVGDEETELPGIGDDNKTESDDIKMSSMEEEDDDEEETDEDSPSGNPMNQKNEQEKEGDSDAAPVTNRKENEVVNQQDLQMALA